MRIDASMPIAQLREPRGHAHQSEVARIAIVELVPRQRRRYTRLRIRSHRVRGCDRAVFGVLVVIDEYAMALFFPPFAGGERRCTLLHFACQRERCTADLIERPTALDA